MDRDGKREKERREERAPPSCLCVPVPYFYILFLLSLAARAESGPVVTFGRATGPSFPLFLFSHPFFHVSVRCEGMNETQDRTQERRERDPTNNQPSNKETLVMDVVWGIAEKI